MILLKTVFAFGYATGPTSSGCVTSFFGVTFSNEDLSVKEREVDEREVDESSVKSDTADEGRDKFLFIPVLYPGCEIESSDIALLPTDLFDVVVLPTDEPDLIFSGLSDSLFTFSVVRLDILFSGLGTFFAVFKLVLLSGPNVFRLDDIIFKYINNLYIKNLTNMEYS